MRAAPSRADHRLRAVRTSPQRHRLQPHGPLPRRADGGGRVCLEQAWPRSPTARSRCRWPSPASKNLRETPLDQRPAGAPCGAARPRWPPGSRRSQPWGAWTQPQWPSSPGALRPPRPAPWSHVLGLSHGTCVAWAPARAPRPEGWRAVGQEPMCSLPARRGFSSTFAFSGWNCCPAAKPQTAAGNGLGFVTAQLRTSGPRPPARQA